MTNISDYFKEGQRAATYYYRVYYPAGYIRDANPELVIKLFLPPVEEQLMQISTPLPKNRKKWISGFKKEQITILANMERLRDDGK